MLRTPYLLWKHTNKCSDRRAVSLIMLMSVFVCFWMISIFLVLNSQSVKILFQNNPTFYRPDTQYLQYTSTQCPTSPRHRMNNSETLQKNYVENVPILLTPDHVTESEYYRLKHFRDMMGWKHTSYQSISRTVAFLNSSSNQYLFDDRLQNSNKDNDTCIRCAVVGNGGILKGSKMDKEIDAHDYVFRTNVAITKGYEKDVGNKTSFYCFGIVTLSNSIEAMKNRGFKSPPWNPDIRYVFLPENAWAYEYIYAALTNRKPPKAKSKRWRKRDPIVFQKPLDAKNIKIVHPDFCRYVEKSWLKSKKLKSQGRATTGTLMLFIALHTCDEVNAYGFGHLVNIKKFTYHYYDEKFTTPARITKVAWHDWNKEKDLLKLLVDEGVFHMYTRK